MNLLKEKTRVLILTHYTERSEEGEDTDMRILNYLKNKVKKIVLITHPLPEFGHHTSYCLTFINGHKVQEIRASVYNGPELLKYLHHILITYYFMFKTGLSFDLCIAMEDLSFVAILPLRLIGLVKRLVYYSLDLIPNRFKNSYLNHLYHLIDKIACKFSDTNWVMVKEQIKERKQFGITSTNSSPFTIVPIGYDAKKIKIQSANKINLNNIIYMGAMRESTGPELIIRTIPLLVNKFPKLKLTMIGAGNDVDKLKQLIKDLKIERHINFLGYVANFWELTDILASSSIGFAPYKPMPDSYSYFADPSKIKLYMCSGLPVITTNVTSMTSLISKTHSGIIIEYSPKSLYDAAVILLSNKKQFKLYKDSAIKLSNKFDINNILKSAITKIPN